MAISWNGGTPKSSILEGSSLINYPFWGTPISGNPHICPWLCLSLGHPFATITQHFLGGDWHLRWKLNPCWQQRWKHQDNSRHMTYQLYLELRDKFCSEQLISAIFGNFYSAQSPSFFTGDRLQPVQNGVPIVVCKTDGFDHSMIFMDLYNYLLRRYLAT